MAEQLNIILVPHTHWDREWYQTFQQFRIRLVHTVNKLLNILDNDTAFSHFMLDGQTIVLDDYLEVEPEQEQRLRTYIRAGRIQVGPWYLQPDEFLVGGESLIRNLQLGLQQAADFGNTMRVGYVPDCFGHIAQLPQILQGFGIDNAVFWRGVGAEAEKSEFYWAAPDGTTVLVIHLADPIGYSNARQMPLAPAEFATRVELLTAQILPKATTNTLLFMNGSDHLEPQDGLPATIAAANDILAHIKPEHKKMIAQIGHFNQNGDAKPLEGIRVQIGTLPQYVATIRQHFQGNGHEGLLQTLHGEMRSSQYSHLLPAVLSTRMWIKQQNTAAEHLLINWVEPLTAWAWKLGAPYPTGLLRLAWKYLLQNHPHDSICGCSIDQVHRENAVRFAQSQQVAEGALALAMQSIVERVNTRAPFPTSHTSYTPSPIVVFNPAPGPRSEVVQATVQFPGSLKNAMLLDEKGQHYPFKVVNSWRQEIGSMPLPRETLAVAVALAGANAPGSLIRMAESMITTTLGQPEGAYGILHVHVDTDQQPGTAQVEVMIAPRGNLPENANDLLAGEKLMLQVLEREDIHMLIVTVIDQAHETIDFVAANLPAYGLKTYWLYPHGLPFASASPAPALTNTLVTQPHAIENEFYRVEASTTDGTLTVIDKQTGAVFAGLNRFVDGGDVGDLYNYCPPAQDTLISQPVEPPKITLTNDGPVRATLRISAHWSLPHACAANRAERAKRMSNCPIVSEISLVPGLRRIDIRTTVENEAKDHRLRVLFPVPYTVDTVAADGTFEVRTRPVAVARPAEVTEWIEEPVNTFPQKRFVDISNGTIGLGILNRGLPEYEVLQDGPAVVAGQMAVAVTLLRCVEWLSRGDLATRRGHAGPMEFTPEGQCLGHHVFDYALVPHSGAWEAEEALVQREALAFNVPVRSMVVPATSAVSMASVAPVTPTGVQDEGNVDTQEKALASSAKLITVEPREIVISAIKRDSSGQGLIVRLYNPLAHAVEAALLPGVATTQAFVANLQEEQQEQLLWNGEAEEPLHVGVRAGGIVTIWFQ